MNAGTRPTPAPTRQPGKAGPLTNQESDCPPVDLALLAEIIGEQDRAELLETAGLLLEELPDLLAPLDAAVATRDRQALADAAHAAKSAASSAAAMPLAKVLDAIENDAAGAAWGNLGMQVEAVRREFERLAAYLDESP